MGDRQEYIHNFARTMMGQLKIGTAGLADKGSAVEIAQQLGNDHWRHVRIAVERLCVGVKGGLAMSAIGEDTRERHSAPLQGVALFEVCGGKGWLRDEMGGSYLLGQIATAAVLAAMADNIWTDLKKGQPLADIESKGILIEVMKAVFQDWKGVQFVLRFSKGSQRAFRTVFVDKDDPICINSGLCERGKNFVSRDKQVAADALLKTIEIHPSDGSDLGISLPAVEGKPLPSGLMIYVGEKLVVIWVATLGRFEDPPQD